MNKEEALARLSTSRRAVQEMIARLSESEITGPAVEGIWSVKDLLGHLAAWEQTLIRPLANLASGGIFSSEIITDHDAWNKEQSEKRRAANLLQIQTEFETIRQELLSNLAKLTDNQWERSFRAPWGDQNTIIEMVSGLAWHEEEHAKSIRKFLENRQHES